MASSARKLELPCGVCGESSIEDLPGFSDLPRVTSDCKPWPAGGRLGCCMACGAIQKPADDAWSAEARQIYGAYEIYHLSTGAEQVIFADGRKAEPRSRALVDFAVAAAGLHPTGALIDIGCGNGAALANFGDALPEWDLHGHDLSDGAEASLRSLSRFRRLFTGDLSSVPGRFDFVSLIHSLEHMPDPCATLRTIRSMLADGGWLLVQVPDVAASPYDLVVADHRTHFTAATLNRLVARAGLRAEVLRTDVLPKELTLLAKVAPDVPAAAPDGTGQRDAADTIVRWLDRLIAHARGASQQRPFGIFGTAIAGMWLFGALRDRIDFFVDEDPARIGRTYEGRPIYAPAQVPPDGTVYVPLAPSIAPRVIARLQQRHALRFVAPPAVDLSR